MRSYHTYVTAVFCLSVCLLLCVLCMWWLFTTQGLILKLLSIILWNELRGGVWVMLVAQYFRMMYMYDLKVCQNSNAILHNQYSCRRVTHRYNFCIVLSMYCEWIKPLCTNKCTYYTNIWVYMYIFCTLSGSYIFWLSPSSWIVQPSSLIKLTAVDYSLRYCTYTCIALWN
jgi:hypothetical protein